MFPKSYICLTVLLVKLTSLGVFGAVFGSSINVCENVSDYIFLQNVEDCSKYFVCINGQAIPQQCRSGLYFDASRQACVATRSRCLQCPKQKRINFPLHKTCDKYVSCYFGNVYLRKCEDQQQFNRITGKCDLAKNVDCVDNRCSIHTLDTNVTYVASAAKCDRYYVCLEGKTKALTCANGLYFSTKCNCCDQKANVECLIEEDGTLNAETKGKRFSKAGLVEKLHLSNLLNANVNIKCPKTGSFIYPYNGNPDYYYTCLDGKASLKACAEGFQYNNTHKRCVKQQAEEDIFMENFELNLAIEEVELYDVTCPEYGAAILPHSESKEKYVLCLNGQPTVYDCGKGLTYNDQLKKCSVENNFIDTAYYQPALKKETHNIMCPKFGTFKYPHANDTHYYLCTDGKVYILACDSDEIFDAEINICRQKSVVENVKQNVNENVKDKPKTTILAEFASNIICPKMGTFMFPHSQRNRYYVCIDGHAIGFACAEGYIYDAEINACKHDDSQTEAKELPAPTLLDEPVNILCPTAGASKFPHVHKNKFYLCINGMGSVMACPSGSSFDVETSNCRLDLEQIQDDSVTIESVENTINCPKLGTFVYAHENETQYYVCLDGKSLILSCNEGLYFDSKEKVCRKPNKTNVEIVKALVNVKEKVPEIITTPQVDEILETDKQILKEESAEVVATKEFNENSAETLQNDENVEILKAVELNMPEVPVTTATELKNNSETLTQASEKIV